MDSVEDLYRIITHAHTITHLRTHAHSHVYNIICSVLGTLQLLPGTIIAGFIWIGIAATMAGGWVLVRLASYGGGFSCSMLRYAGLGGTVAVVLLMVAAASNDELDAFRFSLGRPRMVEKLNVDELVLEVEKMAAVAEVALGGATVEVQLAPAGTGIVVCCSRAVGSSLMASS